MDTITSPLTILDIIGRLLLATAFGAAIGVNRERQRKPAGLRTHALVSLGAALMIVFGLLLGGGDAASRVVQGIVAGIGFIGAGVIMRRADSDQIQGLTTAASIWIVAALGLAAGAGLWRTGLATLTIALIVLKFGERVDAWLRRDGRDSS